MRLLVVCGMLTFLPIAPSVTGQETGPSLLLRLGVAPVFGIPGTEHERDFKTGHMGTLGVGVRVGGKGAIIATVDYTSFDVDPLGYFQGSIGRVPFDGLDVAVRTVALTVQARGDIQLPLRFKGYVSAGPGWMWWGTGGIRIAELTDCGDPTRCFETRKRRAAGFAAAVGLGLRAPDSGFGRFFIESQYTHGFFADAPAYLPIRFGWEIAL